MEDAMEISSEGSAGSSSHEMGDEDFAPRTTSKPHIPSQSELDDLIRDLGLTKSGAELLRSRMKEWNLLGEDCRTSVYRKRKRKLETGKSDDESCKRSLVFIS
ncbi:uncharacterized protein LOC143020131 [Oratosquilla oratoria]|uniref:uncharacterized protein LOC143020131 n=1 Tax=Oratosquilla oratoria TaxID=337810 RepID=UPI003F777D0D